MWYLGVNLSQNFMKIRAAAAAAVVMTSPLHFVLVPYIWMHFLCMKDLFKCQADFRTVLLRNSAHLTQLCQ